MTQPTAGAPPINTSARGRVRQLVEDFLDSADEFQIPTLVQDILHQVDSDRAWRTALLRESLQPYVYELAQRQVAKRRGLILYGSEIMSRERFEQRVMERASRFETWLETIGDGATRRTLKLMKMVKSDLLSAAQARRNAATTDLTLAALFESMARKMPDEATTVEHVFLTTTIAEMEAAIQKHVAVSTALETMVEQAVDAAENAVVPEVNGAVA